MKARIKQSPKLPAEKRRDQLLRAAHRCFREKGYLGTTTEEIARRAGLTKGALYFHFKSKEDILFALIKTMVADFHTAFETLPYGHIAPVDVVRLALALKTRFTAHEFKSMLEIWGQAMRIARIRRFLNEGYRRQIKFIAGGLDPAFGLSRREAEQAAVMVLSMCDGLAVRLSLDDKEVNIKVQLQLMRSLFDLVRLNCANRKKRKS